MSKNEEKSKNLNSLKTVKGKKYDQVKSQKMSNCRIIQKNLVYVIGLSEKLTSKELLGKYEYFGQYGKITKIIVNKNKAYYGENQTRPSYSVYISYCTPNEAALAILAIDSVIADDHLIRASFGTTKYCTFFLKNSECPNKDCLYIHSQADDEVVVNKEELTSSNTTKNIFYEQHLLAIKLANVYDKEVKKTLTLNSKKKSVFPNLETIYNKDIVIKNDPEYIKKTATPNYKTKISFVPENEKKIPHSLSNNVTPKNCDNTLELKIIDKIKSNQSDNTLNSIYTDKILGSFQNLNHIENDSENDVNNNNTQKSIYRNRDKSRFTFVPSDKNEIDPNIPDYVFDVINKKVSRYSFFKKFENDFELENIKNDKIYFEESFLKCGHHFKNDSWKDFIFTNLNIENGMK